LSTPGTIVAAPILELGAYRMSALRNDQMWDMQAPGYPAPLCEKCNIPKWVNWRFLSTRTPFAAVRVGYECRICTSKKKRFSASGQLTSVK
jgi:hypothetical protein